MTAGIVSGCALRLFLAETLDCLPGFVFYRHREGITRLQAGEAVRQKHLPPTSDYNWPDTSPAFSETRCDTVRYETR